MDLFSSLSPYLLWIAVAALYAIDASVLGFVWRLTRKSRALWPVVSAIDGFPPELMDALGRAIASEARGMAERQLDREETIRQRKAEGRGA